MADNRKRCVKRESLLGGDSLVIVETVHRNIVWTATEWFKSYACFIVSHHYGSDNEIILQDATLEECEIAFVETLEDDLCDI
jgi:hypothetical protein